MVGHDNRSRDGRPVTMTNARGGRAVFLDTGAGIKPTMIERMFQPFQSGFRQGSGLGLAIVRRIVTDHGGRVSVQSSPGAGTEVVVLLPAPVTLPEAAIRRSA